MVYSSEILYLKKVNFFFFFLLRTHLGFLRIAFTITKIGIVKKHRRIPKKKKNNKTYFERKKTENSYKY